GALGVAAYAEGPKEGLSPDPPAKANTKHWMFDVHVSAGKLSLTRARPFTYEKAVETPRVHGRFAIEFFVGRELLDRIRFDVPLMGAGSPEKSPRHPFPRPSFDSVTTDVQARMADNPRTVIVALVDRASGTLQRFQWPPEPDGRLVPWTVPKYDSDDAWPPPPSKDAGARDAKAR